jgi:HPt (histidine-containing phosphotransfer) domain-containing protein
MDKAIENDDIMMIENLAHEIKTQSSKIDAIEIKDIAFKIELAARRGNLKEAVSFVEKMKHEL